MRAVVVVMVWGWWGGLNEKRLLFNENQEIVINKVRSGQLAAPTRVSLAQLKKNCDANG